MIIVLISKQKIDRENIFLVGLFDIHIGNRFFDEKLFLETVKMIEENDNIYWIFGGDGLENNTKNSVRSVYEQTMPPSEQKKYLENKTQKIAHKCLGAIEGNHEAISSRDVDISLISDIAKNTWKCPYNMNSILLYLKVGVNYYTICMRHGSGGGSTSGAKLNSAIKTQNIVSNAQIYFTGHTHLKGVVEEPIYIFYEQKETIRKINRYFISAGSYLDYGGYAENKAMSPTSLGSIGVYLGGIKREIIPISAEKYNVLTF